MTVPEFIINQILKSYEKLRYLDEIKLPKSQQMFEDNQIYEKIVKATIHDAFKIVFFVNSSDLLDKAREKGDSDMGSYEELNLKYAKALELEKARKYI